MLFYKKPTEVTWQALITQSELSAFSKSELTLGVNEMSFFKKIMAVSLASTFMVSVAVAGEKEVPQFVEGTVRVSAEEMIELVEKYEDLVIIDSRKKSDVAKGFIEGSVSLPNTETTGASLAANVASKATPVAFYCNGTKCGRSLKAAKIALAEGYSKVFWFRGGIQEWEAKGLPVVHP